MHLFLSSHQLTHVGRYYPELISGEIKSCRITGVGLQRNRDFPRMSPSALPIPSNVVLGCQFLSWKLLAFSLVFGKAKMFHFFLILKFLTCECAAPWFLLIFSCFFTHFSPSMLKVKPQASWVSHTRTCLWISSPELMGGRGCCVLLPALPLYLLWGPGLVTQSPRGLISSSKKESNYPCFPLPKTVVRIKGDVELRTVRYIRYSIGTTPSSWGQERCTFPLPPTSQEAPSTQGALPHSSLYLLSLALQYWLHGNCPVIAVEFTL